LYTQVFLTNIEMKTGIKIFAPGLDFSNSVEINSGVFHHSLVTQYYDEKNQYNKNCKYEQEAFLPKNDWKPLVVNSLKTIKSNTFNKTSNTIYIGKIPMSFQTIIDEIGINNANCEKDVFDIFRQSEKRIKEVNLLLNNFLENLSPESYNFLSLSTNNPGCVSVSFDKKNLPLDYTFDDIKFIGLHKDSSNAQIKIHTSHKFGNRLTINLGKQSRYLLFINLTILQIYNMLIREKGVKKEKINNKNITQLFFEFFPDYPVIRIKQDPYEFYIAPTDNCIHDGSTVNTKSLDIVMTYLGHFKIQ